MDTHAQVEKWKEWLRDDGKSALLAVLNNARVKTPPAR